MGEGEKVTSGSFEHLSKWVERHEREPEVVAKEKLDRLIKVIELKTPDRVPIGGATGDFMVAQTGITWYELSYELTVKVKNAFLKFILEYPSDFVDFVSFHVPYVLNEFVLAAAFSDFPEFSSNITSITGPLHDLLKDKWTRWPGRELAEDVHPQFVGGEFMKPGEYRKLIEDPVGFLHGTILPRACLGLGSPGTPRWSGTWIRIGLAIRKVMDFTAEVSRQIKGYPPPLIGSLAEVPTDFIGDFLRHPTGAMLDMRKYSEDFKAACDALLEPILKVAMAASPKPPMKMLLVPLHLNEMLPPKLYNELYWPYLKRVIETALAKGYKGFVMFEGDHTPHVDTILELPKGWGIGYFEKPRNFIKGVWEKLKGHTIVAGGIPISLFYQPPDKVDEYVKNLLHEIKPEGGFMIMPGIFELPADANPASVKAYINAVLKYGTY